MVMFIFDGVTLQPSHKKALIVFAILPKYAKAHSINQSILYLLEQVKRQD